MILQILIDPERIERRRVEPREEHIHYDEKVDLAALHPQRDILVIVLEAVAVRREIRLEPLVVIRDRILEEIAARPVEPARIEILLRHGVARLRLVRREAENRRDHEMSPTRRKLAAELLIILLTDRDRAHGEHRVEPEHPLPLQIIRAAAHRLLIEMFEDIPRHLADARGIRHRRLAVDRAHLLILDARLFPHRIDIVDAERQDIAIVDRVHDRIGMQLVAEDLRRRPRVRPPRARGIRREDRRAREAEKMIPAEAPRDRRVHISELRPVALIENQHDMLLIDRMLPMLLDEDRELLDRRHDDAAGSVAELLCEHLRRRIAVRRALLETVVLLHRLIIEILAVDDEEHLVDAGQRRRELRRLERGQGLA